MFSFVSSLVWFMKTEGNSQSGSVGSCGSQEIVIPGKTTTFQNVTNKTKED